MIFLLHVKSFAAKRILCRINGKIAKSDLKKLKLLIFRSPLFYDRSFILAPLRMQVKPIIHKKITTKKEAFCLLFCLVFGRTLWRMFFLPRLLCG